MATFPGSTPATLSVTRRAYLELHLAVLLFGFTAILGDLIALNALAIVWWRVLLTLVSLLFLVRIGPLFRAVSRPARRRFAGIGILAALQWLTFYGAIKLSNASIALVALATTSFFTSLLEPLILRQRIKPYEIGLGLLIIPGMTFIVNHSEWTMVAGLAVGLVSAFLASLFTILNKKYIGLSNELNITFLELGSAGVFTSVLLPVYLVFSGEGETFRFWPRPVDWGYLFLLALFCTTLAYVLTLRALQHVSAFTANLAINLEPVYGIALAWLLLRDGRELSGEFYLGAAIILGVVFSYPLVRRLRGVEENK